MNRQVPSRSVCYSDRIGSIYVPDVLAQASEREALPDMLYEYLKTTLTIRQYAQSLELRLRQVSFVELRQLFHRIGERAESCATFLYGRLHDLRPSPMLTHCLEDLSQTDRWSDLSFAGCLLRISESTHMLMGFAARAKTLMDSAVMGGDYGALHMLTDCVYHISRLIALIEIRLPVES